MPDGNIPPRAGHQAGKAGQDAGRGQEEEGRQIERKSINLNNKCVEVVTGMCVFAGQFGVQEVQVVGPDLRGQVAAEQLPHVLIEHRCWHPIE